MGRVDVWIPTKQGYTRISFSDHQIRKEKHNLWTHPDKPGMFFQAGDLTISRRLASRGPAAAVFADFSTF